MSKSENVALYKYLTRPSSPQLPAASSKELKKVMPTADLKDDLTPGPLRDELLKDFDPSQETHEEYLQRKNLERPFNAAIGGRVNFQYGGPAYLEDVFKEAMESNNYNIDDIVKSAAAKKADLYNQTKLGTYKLPTSKQKIEDMFKKYVSYERSMSPEDYTSYIQERIKNPNTPHIEGWNQPLKGTPLEAKGMGSTKNVPVSNLRKAEQMLSPNELKQWRAYTQKQQKKAKYIRKFQTSERFNPETGQFEYDPTFKQEALGKKYLSKNIRRSIKADAYKQLSVPEKVKYVNFEKRLDTIGNIIKENPNYILEDTEVMNKLSTAVDPKTGEIYTKSPSFTDIKNRRIWEVEHIDPVVQGQTKGRGAFLRNLQVLPEPIHKNFKNNAETFLNNHYGDKKYQSQVDNIINKANELKVELRVKDVGKVGYKPTFTNFADKAEDIISTYVKNPKAREAYTNITGNILKSEAFPGAKATGEFISETFQDLATKGSRFKGLLKLAGVAGGAYTIYDTGVALSEGKSIPEIAFRTFGLDPIYNEIKKYNRLPEEAQNIQKKLNAQMSFDASQYDAMDEGLVGLSGRPEVTAQEQMYLDQEKKKVDEKIQQEDEARREGRLGLVNAIKQRIFDAGGTPYSIGFANGGRVFLKDGGKPVNIGRRKFLKLTGQAGTLLAALPFLGKYIKPATKAAPEILETISRSADQMPTYLTKLIEKIKMMGTSKIIGKYDNPDEFIRYDLGDYELFEGAGGARLKRVRDRGEYGYEEFEMQIKKDPETGFVEYEEVSARPDGDGKLKDIDFGIDDEIHLEMKKFADED